MWDRGGVQYTIEAFLNEFTDKDSVVLLIKINPSYGVPDMTKIINELKPKNRNDFASIEVICDNIPYKELNNLYNRSDVFVSSTRAEGFNLPCVESMAVGKPVITTNFGGQTDFVNEENGWLIDYKLETVTEEVAYEEVQWAIPDVEDLRRIMRHCFENQKEVKEKGKRASLDAMNFTWRHSAKKALSFINQI